MTGLPWIYNFHDAQKNLWKYADKELVFLEGWRYNFLWLELDDAYIWGNLYQEFKLDLWWWKIDLVRVMPVVSTVFIYLITSSTGSTGGLQDIKITCVERQDCEKKTWRWSQFIPQGVFVWQFAIFKIREDDWGKKKRQHLQNLWAGFWDLGRIMPDTSLAIWASRLISVSGPSSSECISCAASTIGHNSDAIWGLNVSD